METLHVTLPSELFSELSTEEVFAELRRLHPRHTWYVDRASGMYAVPSAWRRVVDLAALATVGIYPDGSPDEPWNRDPDVAPL